VPGDWSRSDMLLNVDRYGYEAKWRVGLLAFFRASQVSQQADLKVVLVCTTRQAKVDTRGPSTDNVDRVRIERLGSWCSKK